MYAGRGLDLAKLKEKPRKSVTSVTDCAWLCCWVCVRFDCLSQCQVKSYFHIAARTRTLLQGASETILQIVTWATVIPRATSEAIKKGADAVNDVQVVLNNDKALLYINGSQVSEFRGQEPRVGGAMGLFAQSESEQATDWRFLNFAIVENQ